MFFEPLREWFLLEKRDLPWRRERTPYSTWVSEVMLQQTQVAVVIPYFKRWMEKFPSIESLALAPWEEVVKLWEGLGYYSRAKNLQEGAKEVLTRFRGELPQDRETLLSIRGIGPYTAGAILSFAFQQKKGAIDGNVARVLSRLFALHEPVDLEKTKTSLLRKLEELLPDHRPFVVQEALIELGALICQKKAKCSICPLQKSCKAYEQGIVSELPTKKNKIETTYLYRDVAVIENDDFVLLKQGQEGQVMGYLYEFPYLETTKEGASLLEIEKRFSELLQLKLSYEGAFEETKHSFTRYQVSLFPFHFFAEKAPTASPYVWVSKNELETLPFSSGHKRILKAWQQNPSPSFI